MTMHQQATRAPRGVSDDPRGAVEAFKRYTEAFHDLDARAVATFFDVPSLIITPSGTAAARTVAEVEQNYADLIAMAKVRGYVTTDFERIEGRALGAGTAGVVASGTWRAADDAVLLRFEASYVFRRVGADWKVVLAVVRMPNAT